MNRRASFVPRLPFEPRDLTPEQHADLAVRRATPGIVETEEEQAATNEALMADIERARAACEARRWRGGFMPDDRSWGGRG